MNKTEQLRHDLQYFAGDADDSNKGGDDSDLLNLRNAADGKETPVKEQPEPEAVTIPQTVKITHNGVEEVVQLTEDRIREALQKEKDYTHKTQETAREREALKVKSAEYNDLVKQAKDLIIKKSTPPSNEDGEQAVQPINMEELVAQVVNELKPGLMKSTQNEVNNAMTKSEINREYNEFLTKNPTLTNQDAQSVIDLVGYKGWNFDRCYTIVKAAKMADMTPEQRIKELSLIESTPSGNNDGNKLQTSESERNARANDLVTRMINVREGVSEN